MPLLTRECKKQGKFFEAWDDKAKKIDASHPSVVEWLNRRNGKVSANDVTMKQFDNMTLKELCDNHSDSNQFLALIKTRKILADTAHRELIIASSREELVSKKLVGNVCFGYLDQLNRRLPETASGLIDKIFSICERGDVDAREQAKAEINKKLKRLISGTKDRVADRMGDYVPDE